MALDLETWIDREARSIEHESCTKEQNLFMRLLPNSVYSPSALEGMVRSTIGKIWTHCADYNDYKNETHLLHQYLRGTGHNPSNLAAIFNKSSAKLSKKSQKKWNHAYYKKEGTNAIQATTPLAPRTSP